MDKAQFFNNGACETQPFTLPDGGEVTLVGLTVGQRGKMRAAVNEDAVKGQALVVCMGCDILSDDDVETVLAMSGKLIEKMSDQILVLSGLSTKRKN